MQQMPGRDAYLDGLLGRYLKSGTIVSLVFCGRAEREKNWPPSNTGRARNANPGRSATEACTQDCGPPSVHLNNPRSRSETPLRGYPQSLNRTLIIDRYDQMPGQRRLTQNSQRETRLNLRLAQNRKHDNVA